MARLGRSLLPLLAALAAGCGSGSATTVMQEPLATHPASRTHHRAVRAALRVQHRPPAARLALPARLPARSVTVPVLMYHRIDRLTPSLPAITRALTVDPATFAAQMRWLVDHGFHALREEQLYDALEHGAPLPRRPVLITFDDGYRDVLWHAAATLHRLGLPATAFVITGRISGSDISFLTWPELAQLERLGVEVGSHTVTHVELPQLDDAAALHELLASREALEHALGHPVQWFAYPAGKHDPRTAQLVRRAGYVLAYTTDPGAVQSATDPLELHRDEVLDTTGVAGLAAMLAGAR